MWGDNLVPECKSELQTVHTTELAAYSWRIYELSKHTATKSNTPVDQPKIIQQQYHRNDVDDPLWRKTLVLGPFLYYTLLNLISHFIKHVQKATTLHDIRLQFLN